MYGYVQGNPISYKDPSGKILVNAGAAGIGALIGAAAGGFTVYLQSGSAGDIAVAAGIGALGGAVSGFTFGAVGTIAVGALSGGLGNTAGQLVTGGDFSVGQVSLATVAGATGGVVAVGAQIVGESAAIQALTGGLATAETQGIFDFGRSLNQQYPAHNYCPAR